MIVLIGYMGSGKSSVGQLLAKKLSMSFMDLDTYIEEKEKLTISDIFQKKGEVYFRKKESFYLRNLIESSDDLILSLGGGTPCYGNNMAIVTNSMARSVYLKASIPTLHERLKTEKHERPLISHLQSDQELNEFIGKHLFERQHYYQKADITITTDGRTLMEIVESVSLAIDN